MKYRSTRRIVTTLLSTIVFQSLVTLTGNEQVVAGQSEVAIIEFSDGRVKLRRKGNTSTLRRTTLLNAGDSITTEKETRAVLYQAYAAILPLIANQTQTIAELSPPAPQNAITPVQYARLKEILVRSQRRKSVPSPTRMGAPNATLLSLFDRRNSTMLESETRFSWTPVKGATSYVINVYDQNKRIIWSRDTTETRLDFPVDRPALSPSDYKWDVTAKIDNKTKFDPALYDAASFTIVSSERAAEIDADLVAARNRLAPEAGIANLVYISALMEHRRWAQAESELKASLERTPNDQTLWELLMETYMQMELWGAREKARQLSENEDIKALMIRDLKAQR